VPAVGGAFALALAVASPARAGGLLTDWAFLALRVVPPRGSRSTRAGCGSETVVTSSTVSDEMHTNKTSPLSGVGGRDGATDGTALVLYHRGGARSVPLLPGRPVVVGRTAPSDVVIPDATLSRMHARFTSDETGVLVEDLGSTNGTWAGGESVTRARLLGGQLVMLGAVSAAIHGGPSTSAARLGLDGHDRFLTLVGDDVERARFFGRPLAVMMVRALPGSQGHVRNWTARVREILRPVDRTALYSTDVLEVLLPETDGRAARAVATRLVEAPGEPRLSCGLSVLPECAASADRLLESAREALRRSSAGDPVAVAEPVGARTLPGRPAGDEAIVCESAAFQETMRLARRLARGLIPVLLHGETGSGKEVLARFIHREGPRSSAPLVAVNSAAVPIQLVESTLFGHEKGAFTGATQRHVGVFEAASGGTVFLDEIGELDADAQAKLLRVLETKQVVRVGSTREIPVDVRIVAASHRDLEALVAEGRFRQDLFYRLNAMTLRIPPLRERPEDVGPLARRFLDLANAANGTEVGSITAEAIDALEAYTWPGNVRELKNAIERGVVVAEHPVITLDDLPESIRAGAESAPAKSVPGTTDVPADQAVRRPGEDFRTCIERVETEVLVAALTQTGWNQTEAAELLRMPRRTLVHKIRVYRLRKPS
jgi:DNA-binding NtrC family response regulator